MFNFIDNKQPNYFLSTLQDLKGNNDSFENLLSLLKLDNLTKSELKQFKNNLLEYLKELKDDIKVIVENRYVDKVYRDSFYNYFSTKNSEYNRYCLRMSFFKNSFDFNASLFEESNIKDNYLGFLIIRPLIKCIGRNVLNPIAKKDPFDNIDICYVEIPTSCMGFKLKAKGFPHASQDSETMTCAQTTIWSLMEYFGNKYPEYSPVSPSEIKEILEPVYYKRQLPAAGLSISQISMTLKKLGFGCEVDLNPSKYQEVFYERIACYIESGIPLAVGLGVANVGEGHEVVCLGHEYLPKDRVFQHPFSIGGKTIYSWNKAVAKTRFVFNDDNFPCYQLSFLDNPTHYLSGNNYKIDFKITDMEVPLYSKIYMDAKTAIDITYLVIKDYLDFKEEIVVKTYLTSSRSYRNYIVSESDLDEKGKLIFLRIPLPKFIWVTEISSPRQFMDDQLHSLIILDATSTKKSILTDMIIFMESIGTIYEYFADTKSVEGGYKLLPEYFKAFNGNLKNFS